MRLILIVKSKNRPKTFSNTTLKYISRSGYDYRIYVTRKQEQKYRHAISDSVFENYLHVPYEAIKNLPVRIPKQYDLALYLPDNLKGFTDNNLLEFHKQVESMRSTLGTVPGIDSLKDKWLKGPYLEMVKLKHE